MGVAGVVEDRAEVGAGRGHRQGVAVEGADLLVAAVGDQLHDLGGAADRGDRDAAAQRLGQADQVGRDAVATGGAGGPGREARLHLVEGEVGVVRVEQLLQAGEVAVVGRDDAGVHHHRLEDHAGDAAAVRVERPLDGAEVVEGHDDDQVDDRLRDAAVAGHVVRRVGGADVLGLGQHRDLHRVVVAVVAALDLDDEVAAGDGAHQVDRVHGGLGAGVGEAPLGEAEAAGQLLGRPRWRPRSAGRSGCRGGRARRPPRRGPGGCGRRSRRRSRRACRRTRCRRRPTRGTRRRGSSTRPGAGRSASWRSRRRPARSGPRRSARCCAAGGGRRSGTRTR